MTDLDLERLGDVWRQRPNPAELEQLKRSAEAVQRRARWAQAVDIVAAVVVAGVVLLLVSSNPTTDTLIVGGGAILVLLFGQMRSRRLRQKELRSLTGTTEQMLDQSIERVRAGLVRARSALVLLPSGILLGLLVAFVAVPPSDTEFAERFAQPGVSTAIQIAVFLTVAAAIVHFLRAIRAGRREMERLTALRDAYRQESSAAE
jgi:hypothetical protein